MKAGADLYCQSVVVDITSGDRGVEQILTVGESPGS